MTSFTWAWINEPQANRTYGTPLGIPTGIKPAIIHAINASVKRLVKFTASARPESLPPHEVNRIDTTDNRFSSKQLVLKRILRIFKLKE